MHVIQSRAMSGLSLFGNVGGYVGIFLGVCLVQVPEFLEFIYRNCKKLKNWSNFSFHWSSIIQFTFAFWNMISMSFFKKIINSYQFSEIRVLNIHISIDLLKICNLSNLFFSESQLLSIALLMDICQFVYKYLVTFRSIDV